MTATVGDDEATFEHSKKPLIRPGQGAWRELDMSGMGIRYLCPEVRHYSHITALYLGNNNIRTISEELLLELPLLQILDLSSNQMQQLPKSVGHLALLENLFLQNNQLLELPCELGQLSRLKTINVAGNPLSSPPIEVIHAGVPNLLRYLQQRVPSGPPPPERKFISYIENSHLIPEREKFKVFTYNILSDSYVTPERYSCPSWILEWNFRKHGLLREFLFHSPEVLCLQEVQSHQYHDFFLPAMERSGYAGVFAPKSRARTMEDWGTVDGCVIFYKTDRFQLVEKHVMEYQGIAMGKHRELSQDSEAFSRLITKDNVGLIVVLQIKDSNQNGKSNKPIPKHILVANTHIHWNPEQCDVKLIQVQFLLEHIAFLTSPKSKWHRVPLIVSGDFNSAVNSGPYELLQQGRVSANHSDLQNFYYGAYSTHGLSHPLQLRSAYGPIGEPPFTNYTDDFKGVLDYIWYSRESLNVVKVLQPVEEDHVRETRLPNAFMHSDHTFLISEFYFKRN